MVEYILSRITSSGIRTVSTIETAERLKKELTDKWVVVVAGAPELKRFENLTGKVKTVNMSCRALVEFDPRNMLNLPCLQRI